MLKQIYVIDPPADGCPEGVATDVGADGQGLRRPRRAGRRDPTRRHRHADLHQRHDRPAEGRDDQPVQRRLHRRVAAPLLRARHLPRQARRQLPADGAHRRADDEPLPNADPRLQRVLLPRRQPAAVIPQGGASRDRVRRAAGVGEDLQRRQRRAGRRSRTSKSKFDEGVAAAVAIKAAERGRNAPPRNSSTRGRSSMPSPSPTCAP